jgi:hypothetical protein
LFDRTFRLPSGGISFEIPDDCWTEAGMHEFNSLSRSYRACLPPYPQDAGLPQNPPDASLVAITEIKPLIRHLKDGIPDAPILPLENAS